MSNDVEQGGKIMVRYIKPVIDVLYFDEEEILTASAGNNAKEPTIEITNGQYSAYLLNEDIFGHKTSSQNVTVDVRDIKIHK